MSIEERDSLATWRCIPGDLVGEEFEEGGVGSIVDSRAKSKIASSESSSERAGIGDMLIRVRESSGCEMISSEMEKGIE
jgi:hypothetical protein